MEKVVISDAVVSDSDLELLASQDRQTLIEAWCELNSWRWPTWLPNECPPPKTNKEFNPRDRRGLLMAEIMKLVPNRRIWRVWNAEMSDDDFDDFYAGAYENDLNARARYDKKLRLRQGVQ